MRLLSFGGIEMNVRVTVDFQLNDYKRMVQVKIISATTHIQIPVWPPRLDSVLLRVGAAKTVVQVIRISWNDDNKQFLIGAKADESVELEGVLISDPAWTIHPEEV